MDLRAGPGASPLPPHDSAPFACPRCATEVREEFYSPCATCRAELRARYAGAGRDDVVAEAYEPKMNVTPNAVALKD